VRSEEGIAMIFTIFPKLLKVVGMPLVVVLLLGVSVAADTQETGSCSGQSLTLPFADVPSGTIHFCAIGAAYFSGLVNGTSATT
jgi:hypothetical protein